jgi:hypothetical protein
MRVAQKTCASVMVIGAGCWLLTGQPLSWQQQGPSQQKAFVTTTSSHQVQKHGKVHLDQHQHHYEKMVISKSMDDVLNDFNNELKGQAQKLENVQRHPTSIVAWSNPSPQGRQGVVIQEVRPQKSVIYRIRENKDSSHEGTVPSAKINLPTPPWAQLSYSHDQPDGRRQLRIFHCEGSLGEVKRIYLAMLKEQGWLPLIQKESKERLEDFFTLYKGRNMCYLQLDPSKQSSAGQHSLHVTLTLILENKTS